MDRQVKDLGTPEGTMNHCWYFLASLPRLEIKSIHGSGTRNASWHLLALSLRFGKP
jgi:hypothetical protein